MRKTNVNNSLSTARVWNRTGRRRGLPDAPTSGEAGGTGRRACRMHLDSAICVPPAENHKALSTPFTSITNFTASYSSYSSYGLRHSVTISSILKPGGGVKAWWWTTCICIHSSGRAPLHLEPPHVAVGIECCCLSVFMGCWLVPSSFPKRCGLSRRLYCDASALCPRWPPCTSRESTHMEACGDD